MAKVSMSWKGDTSHIVKNVTDLDDRIKTVIVGQFLYAEPEATAYMKEHAPWTDRTAAARNGLHTTHNFNNDLFELVMAHSVNYGIYLEVSNSGKYGIINKTVQHIGNVLMQRLSNSLALLEATT